MRRDDDVRMRRGAWPIAEHVAGFVDPHALQAELVERALQLGAASLLFERRRSDLTESNLILNQLFPFFRGRCLGRLVEADKGGVDIRKRVVNDGELVLDMVMFR